MLLLQIISAKYQEAQLRIGQTNHLLKFLKMEITSKSILTRFKELSLEIIKNSFDFGLS